MKITIEDVSRELSSAASEGGSEAFVAIVRGHDSGEVVIKGNQAGLLGLASELVELAIHGVTGSHRHFDRFSGADEAEVDVVFTKALAPWESS